MPPDNKALAGPAAVLKTPMAPISQVEAPAISEAIPQAIKVTMMTATGAATKAAVRAALPVAPDNMANLMTPTVPVVVKPDLVPAAWMIAMDLGADLVKLMTHLTDQIRDLVPLAQEVKMIAMDPEVVGRVVGKVAANKVPDSVNKGTVREDLMTMTIIKYIL